MFRKRQQVEEETLPDGWDYAWWPRSEGRVRYFRELHGLVDTPIPSGGPYYEAFRNTHDGHNPLEIEDGVPIMYCGGSYGVIEAPLIFTFCTTDLAEPFRTQLMEAVLCAGNTWEVRCALMIELWEGRNRDAPRTSPR